MEVEEYFEELRSLGFAPTGRRSRTGELWQYLGSDYAVPDPANLTPQERGATLARIAMQAGIIRRPHGPH